MRIGGAVLLVAAVGAGACGSVGLALAAGTEVVGGEIDKVVVGGTW